MDSEAQYSTIEKPSKLNIPWFWLGILGIFLLSIGLRFWGLSRFNSLVFDEVHFAQFANNYLVQKTFFENHPPLGKYFIAIGIWLSQWFPFGQGESNTLTGSPLTPFSYRWMNAFIGSFIPIIIAGIAYQLTQRRSYTLIAGFFAALDGLFLVESRYALINIYLVLFGLLGQWLFLLSLERSRKQQNLFLTLAGICFGASFAVKWNGLAFLLGAYLLWISAKIIDFLQNRWQKQEINSIEDYHPKTTLEKLAKVRLIDIICELGIVPLIIYVLAWIPHIQLNTNMNFWEWQKYLYQSQKSVGANDHPYCSRWYTWMLMLRPVAYYFQKVKNPESSGAEIYYDVHAIGNPILWWLSSGAIAVVIGLFAQKLIILTSNLVTNDQKILLIRNEKFWIFLYLLTNYIANLLPWISVTRCTFLYHYMGASVFSLLAIAWFISRYLRSPHLVYQLIAALMIFLIVISFLFWLPIYLGTPLSPVGFQSRMLLRSWY